MSIRLPYAATGTVACDGMDGKKNPENPLEDGRVKGDIHL